MKKLVIVCTLLLSWKSLAQIYDHNDSDLRKSFEIPLSQKFFLKERYSEILKTADSLSDKEFIAIFIVGGPHLFLNPKPVHDKSKDFLEFLHNQYLDKIFLKKLQNNVIWGESEDLLCRLLTKIKSDRPHTKILLTGHSYGASGALKVARCLDGQNVSIDVLVTVDSVLRPVDWGFNNLEVPWNVTENFNFHQKHGLLQNPWTNRRPDGSTVGIKDFKQNFGNHFLNAHMYAFTRLVDEGILQALALKTFEPSTANELVFSNLLQLYTETYPLE